MPPRAIKALLSAIAITTAATSLSAQAALTSYTNSGVGLVYSSVSDVTWTKDANLLGTWIASSTDANGNGTADIIEAIIAASPTITNTPNFYSSTGSYSLTAADFASNGTTTWFGAMGYVNYLNSISYGGTNKWYLPTVANQIAGFNASTNGTTKGDELVELFYSELHGTANNSIPNTVTFENEQSFNYWSGTEFAAPAFNAWSFDTRTGFQVGYSKNNTFYAWAVSPGQITSTTPVPETESVAMLLVGLGLVGGVVRRRQTKSA